MSSAAIPPVQLSGVTKRYGPTTAVSGLDLEVCRAEVLALFEAEAHPRVELRPTLARLLRLFGKA